MFKKGDKVKITRGVYFTDKAKDVKGIVIKVFKINGNNKYTGEEGSTWSLDTEYSIAVEWYENWGNQKINCYKIEELEHARIKNTKLARKLYPNAIEKGEWLEI